MENNANNVDMQKKVTLELSLDEVNVVLAGLGELPAKASLAVIEKVRSQAVSQLQAAPAAPVGADVSEAANEFRVK